MLTKKEEQEIRAMVRERVDEIDEEVVLLLKDGLEELFPKKMEGFSDFPDEAILYAKEIYYRGG